MNQNTLKRIQGSLIGGAVGDALGYAVEFNSENSIFHTYGKEGIREYDLVKGKAIISDDTQMTLFTACGLLNTVTDARLNGKQEKSAEAVADACCDWYLTQYSRCRECRGFSHHTWLWNVPALFVPRAPGNTCLSALSRMMKRDADHRSQKADNNSKGCGGVMRAAPFGLYGAVNAADAAKRAAEAAAQTHGHPLGYLPAAVMADIVHRCVFDNKGLTLRQITEQALYEIAALYADDPFIDDLIDLLSRALLLSENSDSDLNNIHRLGEGWVGDEALAIALYCCLKYPDDFDACIIASVNHKGDSDSTGAIAGNILGAWLGMDAIGAKWTQNLELTPVIDTLAQDLCTVSTAEDSAFAQTPQWQEKYVAKTYAPQES